MSHVDSEMGDIEVQWEGDWTKAVDLDRGKELRDVGSDEVLQGGFVYTGAQAGVGRGCKQWEERQK